MYEWMKTRHEVILGLQWIKFYGLSDFASRSPKKSGSNTILELPWYFTISRPLLYHDLLRSFEYYGPT